MGIGSYYWNILAVNWCFMIGVLGASSWTIWCVVLAVLMLRHVHFDALLWSFSVLGSCSFLCHLTDCSPRTDTVELPGFFGRGASGGGCDGGGQGEGAQPAGEASAGEALEQNGAAFQLGEAATEEQPAALCW